MNAPACRRRGRRKATCLFRSTTSTASGWWIPRASSRRSRAPARPASAATAAQPRAPRSTHPGRPSWILRGPAPHRRRGEWPHPGDRARLAGRHHPGHHDSECGRRGAVRVLLWGPPSPHASRSHGRRAVHLRVRSGQPPRHRHGRGQQRDRDRARQRRAADGDRGPDGQRTTLTVDANGYLATVANPAGETTGSPHSADGLLQTYTTPRNHDVPLHLRRARPPDPARRSGRRRQDPRPHGDRGRLHRRADHGPRTACGPSTSSRSPPAAPGRWTPNPTGRRPRSRTGTDGTTTTTVADGTVTTCCKKGPDPRFGMQAPIPSALTVRMPSGLTVEPGDDPHV